MKPYPQPILIRLSDVSDTGTSTAHRSAYVTTTLPAIVQGLRNLECQDTPFTEFQGPDALFSRLLALLAGTTEYDAVLGNEVERLNALLAEQVEKAETLTRERDEACVWGVIEDGRDEDRSWATGCGEEMIIIEGTPLENDYRFCPCCGRKLKIDTTPTPGAQP